MRAHLFLVLLFALVFASATGELTYRKLLNERSATSKWLFSSKVKVG